MKPIIWDINEMTDSTEIYETRPNVFLTGTIYLIFVIVTICLLWMCFAKIDIVVKGDGLFKGESDGAKVSCGISGKVELCEIKEGQYVEKGQTLFTLKVDSLDSSIVCCKEELTKIEQRIAMLNAYLACLNGEENAMDKLLDNIYYEEFNNRKELLDANIEMTDENISEQSSQYQTNVDNAENSIEDYKNKIRKIEKAIICIKKRKNTFKKKESYYYSIVSSYIASYDNVSLQYDNQIATYQNSIDAANKKKENIQQSESVEEITTEANTESTIATLNAEINNAQQSINSLKAEKKSALKSMELEQLKTLEQERDTANSAIKSLESNITTAKEQMRSLNGSNSELVDDIEVMTEKNNVALELLTYEDKEKECKSNLESLKIQNGNCQVLATASGYVMLQSEVEKGMYIQQGTEICRIVPEKHEGYYAEVYIQNKDVAKLDEGQEVKFEIAAYPSSEYGYFIGTLDSISKDVKVDQSTGIPYYIAKVRCDKVTVSNDKGEIGTIQNGMACQAKIVVEEESILKYLLNKAKLLD